LEEFCRNLLNPWRLTFCQLSRSNFKFSTIQFRYQWLSFMYFNIINSIYILYMNEVILPPVEDIMGT
jgi:hypothetical protein